jgi:hypothetical protein
MRLPQLFAAIGSDHYLSPEEVTTAVGPHAELDAAWRLYQDLFSGFCGSRLDPHFARHTNPARQLGTLRVEPGTTAVVVGTGASLEPRLSTLRQLRSQLVLMTSPEGAERLAVNGLIPDLVVIDPPTTFDAHAPRIVPMSASRRSAVMRCPLVAASPRTPGDLLYGVSNQKLFVPDPLPTWGLWPATAVALAMASGAARIGLIGIDGVDGVEAARADVADRRSWPLADVLSLLAWISETPCVDCGPEGGRKSNWPVEPLAELATGRRAVSPVVERRPWSSQDERFDDDQARVRNIEPVIARARALFDLGVRAQSGTRWHGDAQTIEMAAAEMIAWKDDLSLRIVLQDTLGLAVLSRLWRGGVGTESGFELWRPVVLAMHELVHQAERLESRLALRLCA